MLKKLFGVVFFAILMPAAALACPSVSLEGYNISYTGSDLYSERTVRIVAGGSNVDNCKIVTNDGVRPSGFFADAPDIELYFTGAGSYDLRIWVDGDCDSKLLVNTAAGNWFYDDDDGPDLDARLTIQDPSEGLYDIWIGTYGADLCDSIVRFETF